MSSKYQTLRTLAAQFSVPRLLAITEQDLASLWQNHRTMHLAVERILTEINLTSSAFLDEHLSELESVLRPQWCSNADAAIAARLAQAGLSAEELLAVRSSGAVEDSQDHSYAGLFVSQLNVAGMSALRKAIETVWASNFGRAVLIERLRRGSLRGPGEMTVIVQRMVPGSWAGVAFSHDPVSGEPGCIVEAVQGTGEALMSGESRGIRARIAGSEVEPSASCAALNSLLQRVAVLVESVRNALGGHPLDIEWVFDGEQLWLVQARRITTIGATQGDDSPVFEAIPLYAAVEAELEAFRPLPDFAQYFRSKRRPLVDFAMRMGLPAATSLLIRANRAALEDPAIAESLMAQFKQSQLLLDLSARVRQQVLPQDQVLLRLRELIGPTASTFVLRDFVRGEGGLITQPLHGTSGTERILCEWSQDGLLAINRGTATTIPFVVNADGSIESKPNVKPPLSKEQAALLNAATLRAQVEFGTVQLEWVIDAGQPYVIDYSLLDSVSLPPRDEGTRIISAGYAHGIPVLVETSRALEQLSIAASVSLTDIPKPEALGSLISGLCDRVRALNAPVIVVSPRPYAALAPLVPFVAGFIFEQASTLCHLAILLREQGIPAIESLALYQQAHAPDIRRLTVDASTS